MDIYCPKCGEPWDMDELHYVAEEEGSSFAKVKDDFFRGGGCEILGSQCSLPPINADKALQSRILYDLLGDDVDGIASSYEDLDEMSDLWGYDS